MPTKLYSVSSLPSKLLALSASAPRPRATHSATSDPHDLIPRIVCVPSSRLGSRIGAHFPPQTSCTSVAHGRAIRSLTTILCRSGLRETALKDRMHLCS
eukprot:scaffold21814_cov65-Phaeocystis_antarctica.AAC.1